MAASIISQSCSAASNLYTTALASITIAFPTLLPSSPSSNIFSAPLPFTLEFSSKALVFPRVTLPAPIQDLTFWQITNLLIFIITVAMLSWMLDSHHSDIEDEVVPTSVKKSTDIISTPNPQPSKFSTSPPSGIRRRRQTLETIAALVNLEDFQKKVRSRPRRLRTPLPSLNINANSAPTSPTDIHAQFINTPMGKSTTLLKKTSEREKDRQRRQSLQEDSLKKQLRGVAEYDANMQLKIEEAEWRRRGSWKTGMLLGLRLPIGWAMS